MGFILWLIAVVLVIASIVQLFQGQILLGLVLIVRPRAAGTSPQASCCVHVFATKMTSAACHRCRLCPDLELLGSERGHAVRVHGRAAHAPPARSRVHPSATRE